MSNADIVQCKLKSDEFELLPKFIDFLFNIDWIDFNKIQYYSLVEINQVPCLIFSSYKESDTKLTYVEMPTLYLSSETRKDIIKNMCLNFVQEEIKNTEDPYVNYDGTSKEGFLVSTDILRELHDDDIRNNFLWTDYCFGVAPSWTYYSK